MEEAADGEWIGRAALRLSRENLLVDVSQQPGSGRLVSQQKLLVLHSRTASFPDAVLSA